MSLGTKQEKYSRALPILFLYVQYHGYEIRQGDAFRDKRAHGDVGIKMGYGHRNSCHKLKLAQDIYITKDGVYLEGIAATKAHNLFHDFWDMLGGAERIPHDLNHYSFEHQGMR